MGKILRPIQRKEVPTSAQGTVPGACEWQGIVLQFCQYMIPLVYAMK